MFLIFSRITHCSTFSLGYGDISPSALVNASHHIPTPNIQRLADGGKRFLRGYSGQVCAPSRCSLMTGQHSGHCTIRGNDGAYSPLLSTDTTIAAALRSEYNTALFGKWGISMLLFILRFAVLTLRKGSATLGRPDIRLRKDLTCLWDRTTRLHATTGTQA